MNFKNSYIGFKEIFLIFFLFVFSGYSALRAQTSTLVSLGDDGLVYTADEKGNKIPDFSGVGYRNSEVPIPDVPVVLEVSPVAGDNRSQIQNAITEVSAMPLQTNGFRGAILFKKGEYDISSSLSIAVSGIVLRGEGDSTLFRATGKMQYSLVNMSGPSGKSNHSSTEKQIIDTYVPIGALSVTVQSGHSFHTGDWVHVRREPNHNWIHLLGMDLLHLDPKGNARNWTPGGYQISYERRIVEVKGNLITFDAPFVDIIDEKYAKGFVVKFTSGRIENCGVENMKIVSTYQSSDDENHAWTGVEIDKAEHCWVRDVNFMYFGNHGVTIEEEASFTTVDNCSMLDPVSRTTGGRKYCFNITGGRNLVQNCVARGGRHDFVNGSRSAGPNVFYNCVTTGSTSESGPHHRWSTGILYDNVNTNYAHAAKNREYSGTGHGWAGGQIMFWNCEAGRIIVEDPPGDQVNWAIGCIAPVIGDDGQDPAGVVESPGMHIDDIPSLFLSQLNDRLGLNKSNTTGKQ